MSYESLFVMVSFFNTTPARWLYRCDLHDFLFMTGLFHVKAVDVPQRWQVFYIFIHIEDVVIEVE